MQTQLQNTEVEESLAQAMANDDSNTEPISFDGELIEDDEGNEGDVQEDVQEKVEASSDGSSDTEVGDGDVSDGGGDDEDNEEMSEDTTDEDAETSELSKSLGRLKTPKGRDYSKFSEEDAKYLKQMSNDAFEHFSKRAEENHKLQEALTEAKETSATADHPDAYLLSDDYKEAATNLTKAQQEQAHWRAQLIKIRNGESWHNIEGYDKTGQLMVSKDVYKPTQQSEIDVEMAMQEAAGLGRKFNDKLESVSKSYNNSYKDAVQLLEHEQKTNFAWTTDDAVAQQEIVIPNVGSTTIHNIKTTFANALPKTFQKHPLAELASNLYVTLQLQSAHAEAEKAAVKEASRKEPKAKRKSTSGATASSTDDLTIPDWMDI
jgi:hypothetical protein